MYHKAASLAVLVFCLILLTEVMSQDLPGGDQRSTIMEQSDCYRRRIESREFSKTLDASRDNLLEQSDTKFDYALLFFIGLCLAVLLFISSRRYETARKRRLGSGPS